MKPLSGTAPATWDYVLLLALSAIFGASFMFTHLAVDTLTPLTITSARLLMALAVLFPIMRIARQKLPNPGPIWIPVFGSAVFGYALPFTLINWGQQQVQASLASIFMALMPLATLMLAHVVTSDEKLNRWKIMGVLCGLLGVVVLFGSDALGNITSGHALSQLAILAAAICYAINALITRALVSVPKLSMLTALLLASTVLVLPLSLSLEQPWLLQPSWQSVAAVLVLALGPTAFATLLILVIIDRQGASFLSQINFLVPLFGVLFGWFFLKEQLTTNAWLALFIILCGVGLSRQGNRRLKSKDAPVHQR